MINFNCKVNVAIAAVVVVVVVVLSSIVFTHFGNFMLPRQAKRLSINYSNIKI
jgi:hypothetical protein